MRRQIWSVPLTLMLAFALAAAEPCIQRVNAQSVPAFVGEPAGDEATHRLLETVAVTLSTTRVLAPSTHRGSRQTSSPHLGSGTATPRATSSLSASRSSGSHPDMPLRC